ncbi:MAG: ABC transporter permease [Armatimonadota bacterium]
MMVIWAIAKTTLGDAMRKKVLQIFLVVAIGLIVLSYTFSGTLAFSTRGGGEVDLRMVKNFGLGMMWLAGLLITLVMGVSIIPTEVERRTIYTILSKPVNRYEFIIGKFIGAALTLGLNIGLMGIVFIIMVAIKAAGIQPKLPEGMNPQQMGEIAKSTVSLFDINMVYGVILTYLQFLVLSSIVLLFSIFLTPTVNFFMGGGIYIVGLFASLTETIARSEQAGVYRTALYRIIHLVVPNFDKYQVTNSLVYPNPIADPGMYTIQILGYSLMYSLIMMVIAVILFERKEV